MKRSCVRRKNASFCQRVSSASKPMVDQAIAEDPTIYPPAEVDAKLFTFAVLPPEVDRQYTRIWTELKTGR